MEHYRTVPFYGASTAGEWGSRFIKETGNLHRKVRCNVRKGAIVNLGKTSHAIIAGSDQYGSSLIPFNGIRAQAAFN